LGISLKPGIFLKKIWFDDDVIELKVEVCDGNSTFSNKVYIGAHGLENLLKELSTFRNAIHGGIHDFNFGSFGPETAGGGFQARLHFYEPGNGKLYISTYQQSAHETFKNDKAASEARMYLKTEPVQLDNFIAELKTLNTGDSEEAKLECYSEF
jgi:hypothetical protein